MKIILFAACAVFLAALAVISEKLSASAGPKTSGPKGKIYSFSMKTIDGNERSLADYKGQVLMIVNVASKCGYTPQYEALQAVFEKYKDRGFRILAFPANNFFRQEPGTDQEIKTFCETNYHVTFDLFSKISVKGDDQHPLYEYLTKETDVAGPVKWNFQKYLVDREGTIAAKFSPDTKPDDPKLIGKLEELLQAAAE